MINESEPPPLRADRLYRCLPTLCEANIVGSSLVNLDGTHLQFFSLDGFALQSRLQVLSKEDLCCAQLTVASDNVLVIFGVDKLVLFNVADMAIVETIKVNYYIEKVETKSGFVVVLTSDEDSEQKLVHCWQLCPVTGRVLEKFKATPFLPAEFEDCSDDNLSLALIVSIEKQPRVYAYWRGTHSMVEVDPLQQQSELYNRQCLITHVTDLTPETYAEILDNRICVFSKKACKRVAQLSNAQEKFERIFGDGSKESLFTISDLGLKRWRLETNSEPALYISSDKYAVKEVFLWGEKVLGLNRDESSLVVWDTPESCHAHSFPDETVRRVLRVDDNRVFFLLEATATSLEEDNFHVSKYNKLEVFDLSRNAEVAKKAMLQAKYSVDGESVIISNDEGVVTIRFIVNEEAEGEGESPKKYLLRWTPFHKDENQKDTKKKELKGASKFDSVRLYPFNRILGLVRANATAFSLFSKEHEEKTSLTLFDHSAKKVGEYDFAGDVRGVEISEQGHVYTVGHERVSIYAVDAKHKNRLEKVNELDIQALSVLPYRDFLLVRKAGSFLLLDADFECVIQEEAEAEGEYRVIPRDGSSFFLKTGRTMALWDHEEETVHRVELPECRPELVAFVGDKLLVASKWVQAFDLNIS